MNTRRYMTALDQGEMRTLILASEKLLHRTEWKPDNEQHQALEDAVDRLAQKLAVIERNVGRQGAGAR
jgi:hypothetical protein